MVCGFLYFRIMLSGLIHVVTCFGTSFFLIPEYYPFGFTVFCLYIHQSVDIFDVPTFGLL